MKTLQDKVTAFVDAYEELLKDPAVSSAYRAVLTKEYTILLKNADFERLCDGQAIVVEKATDACYTHEATCSSNIPSVTFKTLYGVKTP